jgi:transposase
VAELGVRRSASRRDDPLRLATPSTAQSGRHVSLLDGIAELLGDKAYDSNSFRKSLRKDGVKPVIPGRSNRKKRIRHDKQAYKDRNVIERCYCRLEDFRRIATRYDKLAQNFFSALCLVAVWL